MNFFEIFAFSWVWYRKNHPVYKPPGNFNRDIEQSIIHCDTHTHNHNRPSINGVMFLFGARDEQFCGIINLVIIFKKAEIK